MADARFLASREARWHGSTSTSTSTSTHDHDPRGEGSGDVRLGRSPGQGEAEIDDDGPWSIDCDDNVLAAGPRSGDLSPSPPKLPLAAPPQARKEKKFSFVKYREFVARAGQQQHRQQQMMMTTTTATTTASSFQQRDGSLTDLEEEEKGTTRLSGNPRDVKDQNNAEAVEAEAEEAPGPAFSKSSSLSSMSPPRGGGGGNCTTCRAEHLVRVHVVLDGRGHVVRTSAPRRGNDDDDDISPFADADPAAASWTTAESHEEEPSYPAVIRDVDHSVVELLGRFYPSIHLLKVRHSTIHIGHGAPQGALHVTNCHFTHVRVNGPVQQLRIHDASHLNVHLATVTGGVILENCTAITFYVDAEEGDGDGTGGGTPSLLDVKDFSFLKRGVPSPNYTVVRRAAPYTGNCGDGEPSPRDPLVGGTAAPPATRGESARADDHDDDGEI